MSEETKARVDIRHKNALGYTIQADGSRYDGGATIMVGKTATGELVSIYDVLRGGRCNLLCDCGAPLVAKKGDERAHHFAHEAGSTSECAVARDSALGRFAIQALSNGLLRLPTTVHRTKELVVVADRFDICNGAVRLSVRFKEILLFVYLATKARQCRSIRQQHLSPDIWPTVLIDLTKCRHLSDDEIRKAISFTAPRYWTYNKSQRDLDVTLVLSNPLPARLPVSGERAQNYALGSIARRSPSSFDRAIADSQYIADLAARRLRDAVHLHNLHRPEAACNFVGTPLTCLGEMTPAQYNQRYSDIVSKIERYLGLRDAAGRPIDS